MERGMGSSLNILQQSPYDRQPPKTTGPAEDTQMRSWVPSRFNVRAVTDDDGMILWNTYRGSLSVFRPEQKETVTGLLSKKGFKARPEGLVKYLRDRGFLIAKGSDEYRHFKSSFGQQHYRSDSLEITMLASEDCNFRCSYCYEKFARGTMEPWVRGAIKKFVQQRAEQGGLRRLVTGWFGGEPLYGLPAIEELAPFFHELVEEHDLSHYSHMTTNGYLLTPEVADKLLAWGVFNFQITIDGAPEDHDCSRPARNGEGTFATIFNNIRAMSQRPEDEKFLIDIRINFDKNNHPNLEGFLDLVETEIGPDPRFKFRFRPVGRWGGSNDENLEVCGLDDGLKVKNFLIEEARKRGFDSCDDIAQLSGLGTQVCYAARPYHFVIGADGKIMKCTVALDMKDHNVVGWMTEDGKMDLDREKFTRWTEAAFLDDKKCQKCVVLPLCQGISCPLGRIDYDNSPCIPLRKNLKNELRAAYDARMDRARKVVVRRDGAAPVTEEAATH